MKNKINRYKMEYTGECDDNENASKIKNDVIYKKMQLKRYKTME